MPGTEEALACLKQRAEADGHLFFAVSAVTGEGLDQLVAACASMVADLRSTIEPTMSVESINAAWERSRTKRDQELTIKPEGKHAWRVTGGQVERMVVQTDWENDEAIAYLQHRFNRMGLDDKLAKMGCEHGDEVRILGFAFDYEGAADDGLAYEDDAEQDEG